MPTIPTIMSRQIPSNHENNVGSALAARGIDVMARLRDGTYEELMCPPEWTKALKKRVKSLPKTNMVWIVDCVNQNTPKTVDLLCTVAMVLKEEGSNGKPWLFYGQNQGEKCDGLGSPALAFTGVTLKRDKANLTAQVDVVLRSLAKACLEPVRATLASKKPKKVLFTKDAILQGAAVTLRSLGIKEVGIADKDADCLYESR